MKITSNFLRDTYITLCKVHPFNKWDMPAPELCKFIVNNDDEALGTYCYTEEDEFPHVITISRNRLSFYLTCVATLAHEMIHCSRWKDPNEGWSKHDTKFRKRAKMVATEFGSFDPLEL